MDRPLIITDARLLDPETGGDEIGALRIEDGLIAEMGAVEPDRNADTLMADGLCLAPGLIDLRVKTGEPGEEHRETLATAGEAAAAGGITSMFIMPDTQPVIDDVALVEFIGRRGADTAKSRIYPIGGLTRGLSGNAMAEMGLMSEAGVRLFSNGETSVANASVMKRALKYAASLDLTVYTRAEDAKLAGSGVMNSGDLGARLGLAGIGREAEWTIAMRDLILAEVTGASYLLDQASTPRTVELVADARQRGVKAACTVAAHSLFFNERDVGDYLTYCKVTPPFRSEEDREGLIAAVAAGQVDAVVSAHDPQPPEEKRVPFQDASFGAAGLETLLAAMLALVHDGPLTLIDALKPLTIGPATLAGLQQGRLAVGTPADLILFDPDKPWFCKREELRSRSTNSPFDGRRLQGRVMQTFVGGERVFTR